MKILKGFDDIDYTDWIIFKMIIKIYGVNKLILTLHKIEEVGGIDEIHTVA
jgi:hypothetical protein